MHQSAAILGMPYLLLFHELGIGAVVDNILAENRSGKDGVDLFGTHVAKFAVENEVVALGADAYGRLLAEENEGENIAMLRMKELAGRRQENQILGARVAISTNLRSHLLEEPGRINSVFDGASEEREQMEDYWRFIGIFEEHLLHDVEDNGDNDDASKHHSDLGVGSQLLEGLVERLHSLLENTHGDKGKIGSRN